MSQPKAKKTAKSRKMVNKRSIQYFVCGRCCGHFTNLREFTEHVAARSCQRLEYLMVALEHALAEKAANA